MPPKGDTRCFLCGDIRGYIIQEHHAIPRRYNGSDDEENLYSLCANCHAAVEEMYDESFYNRISDNLGIEEDALDRIRSVNNLDEGMTTGKWVTDEKAHLQTCKAVYDEALHQGIDDGWVPVQDASARIRRYLPESETVMTTSKLWGNLLEHISEAQLARKTIDETSHLRCTEDAQKRIFASGSTRFAGSGKHRILLRDAYQELTKIGFTVEIPHQDGGEMPDAYATLDDVEELNYNPGTTDPRGVVDAVEEFEDERPLLSRLSNARGVVIEAECTTAKTKPAQTIKNLAGAVNRDKRCLFVCRKSLAPTIWKLFEEEPPFMATTGDERTHKVYNLEHPLTIGGERVYRPAGGRTTRWRYDPYRGEYSMGSGQDIYVESASPEDVFRDSTIYPMTAREGDEVNTDEWTPVKRPLIPDETFDGELPGAEEWDIIVVSDGGLEVYDGEEYIGVQDLLDHEASDRRGISPFDDLRDNGNEDSSDAEDSPLAKFKTDISPREDDDGDRQQKESGPPDLNF